MAKDFFDFTEKMSTLKSLIDKAKDERKFKDLILIFIQHQLGNHFSQTSSLIELGQDPKKVYWIDIPYTSSVKTREAIFKELKVPIENFDSHEFKVGYSYDEYQIHRVKEWILRYRGFFFESSKILILDDGGYFIRALMRIRDGKLLSRICQMVKIIEQTTRGIIKTRESFISKKITVVNVAESSFKKIAEAEYIGKDIYEAINESLFRYHITINELDGNILVLGYGSIGKNFINEILHKDPNMKSRIIVWDIDTQRLEEAKSNGLHIYDESKEHFIQLAVGCTGGVSFRKQMVKSLIDNSYLISASSGDVEFSRYREKNIQKNGKTSIHTDLQFEEENKLLTLLNNGFPINFNGQNLFRIPAEKIQFTVLLMVLGCFQAINTKKKGIIKFSTEMDEFLFNEYRKLGYRC